MRNEIDYNGQTFTDDTLADGSGILIQTESLDGRELSVNTFQFTAESAQDLTLFTQNTPAVFRHRGIQRGTVYIQTVEQVQRTFFAVSAFSAIGKLLQRTHMGGVYNGVRADTIMAEICGDIPFRMASVFASTLVYGYLPIQDARLSLMQLLFALNANLTTDENGVLVVENLPAQAQSVLDADKVYEEGARVQRLPPVTAVTVLEHQYVSILDTEPETLFEGVTVQGQTITFRDPMFDLTADGFTITESGANYAVVSAGNGTLTGKPYTHITREITKPVTSAPVENVERIEDATLVGLTASNDVVDRLVEYYSHREWIYEDVITTHEAPGMVASLFHPYTLQQVLACLASSTTVLSTVLKSSIAALVGFTPWQVVPFEDVRVVLTGSGTFTVPEGVTQIVAVLISGGDGGFPGNKGDPAPAPPIRNHISTIIGPVKGTDYYTGYGFTSSGDNDPDSLVGGKGGQPGIPGPGGRVLRIELSVTPGQEISFRCGVGGEGVPFGSDTPNYGTESTFGSASSSDGSSRDEGYTDPITGEVYAAVGNMGIAGGTGASLGYTPPDITVDEQSWSAGAHPTQGYEAEESDWEQPFGYRRAYSFGGGFGGGPAYGNNGGNGLDNASGLFTRSAVTVIAATPGAGATALPPPDETTIGKGGTSGNGGGGQGSTDKCFAECIVAPGVTRSSTNVQNNSVKTDGGDGSRGGKGGPGGILLYFRRPISTE